jgi:hypothetical protein
MKLKIYTITTLFILLSATFSQSIFAQVTKKQMKVLTRDEIDKREVEKFVDKFTKSFEKTKDIRLISSVFFSKDFKTNFLKTYRTMFLDKTEDNTANPLNQLNDNELYDYFTLGINFSYLNIMIHDGICCEGNSSELFLPKILKKFNKSEARSASLFVNANANMPVKNIKEFVKILKAVNNAQERYVKNLPSTWKVKYRLNITGTRERFESYKKYTCPDHDCESQKLGTEIFEIAAFPYVLRIKKENSDFKILNIFPYFG